MSERQLFQFPGGVHLPHWKSLSDGQALTRMPVPEILIISLQEYAGETVRPTVTTGDQVCKGDLLAEPASPSGVPVHASSSGIVTALEHRPAPGLDRAPCVVLRTDGLDRWTSARPAPMPDPLAASPEQLLERIRACGVVGLGGAGFPTAFKLDTARKADVRQLIINGIECESCITCDDRLLRERAADVVSGIRIVRHILQAAQTVIALEEDRIEARKALEQALLDLGETDIEVVAVPVIYPAGGERQLIRTLTGQEVPAHGLPVDIGMVCQNVGTAAAVHRGVVLGEPLISRVVTVTGPGVREPRNLEVPIGTPVSDVIRAVGGYGENVSRLIMGGPMMGIALDNDDLPVTKATNCLLAGDHAMLPAPGPSMPCIRCGACSDACPAGLLPQQLFWYARSGDLDQLREHQLSACIECGACDYVCPSHIPLVRHFRESKAAIQQHEQQRQRAELARQRYILRQERLERERMETEERRRRKKEALRQHKHQPDSVHADNTADPRKAAIQAAIERARKKKTERPDGHADDN